MTIRYRTGIALAFALIFAAMAIAANSHSDPRQVVSRDTSAQTNWKLIIVTGDDEEDRAREPAATDLTHRHCVETLLAIYQDKNRELNFTCRKVKP